MTLVKFTLPAEALGQATEALLLGDFNNWDITQAVKLSLTKEGFLSAELSLQPGVYQYRYLLNDGRWENDWAAERYVFNNKFNVENSIITVVAAPAKPAVKKAVKKAAAAKPEKVKKAPAKVVATVADDLTQIEGIGDKIAKLLAAEKIVTFKDLSKATGKKLKAILEAAGNKYKMHNPASWPKQAKLAASNKWDELKALQDELKGGK